jgi:hypothetical protein
MIDISKLKSHATELLERSGDDSSQERAAALIKTIEEIEGERANTIKILEETKEISLRRKEEARSRSKELFGIVTPFVTTLVLAGTLIFQGITFRASERDKTAESQRQIDLAEKARWTEALKLLSEAEKRSPAAALLRSFTTSPYREYAQKETFTLLKGRESDPSGFKELFDSTLLPADRDSLPDILQLNRELFEQENPLLLKQWDFQTKTADRTKLNDTDQQNLNRLQAEIAETTSAIVPVLTSVRPAKTELNLRSVDLFGVDLSASDLSGADIEASSFSYVLFDNANLDHITSFNTSTFQGSPWWHAARISPELLNYMKDNYPFDPQRTDYKKSRMQLSESDYQDSLKRLTQQNSK